MISVRPVERRRGFTDGTHREENVNCDKHDGAIDSNRKGHKNPVFFANVRERVPTIFLLCMIAMIFLDSLEYQQPTEYQIGSTEPDNSSNLEAQKQQQQQGRDRVVENAGTSDSARDGFMVLGMHRSGTSMLTGLLYMAAGYRFGGALHKGNENPRGFFERFDVVGQNIKFMKQQGIEWQTNVQDYDWNQALKDLQSQTIDFKDGNRALKFFNNPKNTPWLQKDPRMCITLKTWLELDVLNKDPAIVFTYRHPLEVALSIQKRSPRLHLTKGFQLWIVYNMRAIQNSRGLCIVKTSNTAVLADSLNEIQRISDELTSKCGVLAPKNRVSQAEVDKFIDPNLQHHDAKAHTDQEVLERYNDGACLVYDYESQKTPGTAAYEQERKFHMAAMKIYCDLESGKAYEKDYEWPDMSERILTANRKRKKAL